MTGLVAAALVVAQFPAVVIAEAPVGELRARIAATWQVGSGLASSGEVEGLGRFVELATRQRGEGPVDVRAALALAVADAAQGLAAAALQRA